MSTACSQCSLHPSPRARSQSRLHSAWPGLRLACTQSRLRSVQPRGCRGALLSSTPAPPLPAWQVLGIVLIKGGNHKLVQTLTLTLTLTLTRLLTLTPIPNPNPDPRWSSWRRRTRRARASRSWRTCASSSASTASRTPAPPARASSTSSSPSSATWRETWRADLAASRAFEQWSRASAPRAPRAQRSGWLVPRVARRGSWGSDGICLCLMRYMELAHMGNTLCVHRVHCTTGGPGVRAVSRVCRLS